MFIVCGHVQSNQCQLILTEIMSLLSECCAIVSSNDLFASPTDNHVHRCKQLSDAMVSNLISSFRVRVKKLVGCYSSSLDEADWMAT